MRSMNPKRKPRSGGPRRGRSNRQRRRITFKREEIDQIDYKNLELLKKFSGETCKITPSRVTGVPVIFQRRIALEMKRARAIALLPYTDRHKTH